MLIPYHEGSEWIVLFFFCAVFSVYKSNHIWGVLTCYHTSCPKVHGWLFTSEEKWRETSSQLTGLGSKWVFARQMIMKMRRMIMIIIIIIIIIIILLYYYHHLIMLYFNSSLSKNLFPSVIIFFSFYNWPNFWIMLYYFVKYCIINLQPFPGIMMTYFSIRGIIIFQEENINLNWESKPAYLALYTSVQTITPVRSKFWKNFELLRCFIWEPISSTWWR